MKSWLVNRDPYIILAYYDPYITKYNSLYTANNQGFGHCSCENHSIFRSGNDIFANDIRIGRSNICNLLAKHSASSSRSSSHMSSGTSDDI